MYSLGGLITRKTDASLGVRMPTQGEFVIRPGILIGVSLVVCLLNTSCFSELEDNSHPLYKPSSIDRTQHLKTHENTKVGYQFLYHEKYRLQEPGTETVGFQRANNTLLNSMVWVWARRIPDMSALDVAINYLAGPIPPGPVPLNPFKVPRPTSSLIVSRHRVVSEQYPFTTPYGVKGYELYFVIESTDKEGAIVRTFKSPPGPVFVFDISTQEESGALLFLGANSKEDLNIIRTFANSLRLVQKPNP